MRPGPAWALVIGVLLAGCDDETQPAPVVTATQPSAPAAAPGTASAQPGVQPTIQPGGQSDVADVTAAAGLSNDPSAPANTPLCGIAAQENNAISRQLLPRQYAEAGQCSAYACYDAATATYIGADGYRHVCR